jgi:hypothetical protein
VPTPLGRGSGVHPDQYTTSAPCQQGIVRAATGQIWGTGNALWDAELRDPRHLEVLRELADEARRGPQLPMPRPRDTGDEHLVDGEYLAILQDDE